MRPFSIRGASHYCGSFRPKPGIAEQSPEEFWEARLGSAQSMYEGTSLFDEYRACALRDAERSLFLSASHYRRALDLMIPSSSHWAQVTLYYGAFLAARALLGMLGCGVIYNYVIHVGRSTPGSQELTVERMGSGEGRYFVTERGSHKRFWEIFYQAISPMRRLVDAKYETALVPVSSRHTWLIDQRNQVNYRTTASLKVAREFQGAFTEGEFPDSLPGSLQTQYKVSEGLLASGCSFARRFGLTTDALDFLGSSSPFADVVGHHIYDLAIPDLVGRTDRDQIF